jgi:hypothetical protein
MYVSLKHIGYTVYKNCKKTISRFCKFSRKDMTGRGTRRWGFVIRYTILEWLMFSEIKGTLFPGFRQCVRSPQNDFYRQRTNVNASEIHQVARSAILKRVDSTGVYSAPTPWTVFQLSMPRLDSSSEWWSFLRPCVSIPHPQELVTCSLRILEKLE